MPTASCGSRPRPERRSWPTESWTSGDVQAAGAPRGGRRQHEHRPRALRGLLASAGREDDPPGETIVASVVPSLKFPLRQALRQITGAEPLFVEPGISTGMPILYDTPQE